MKKLLLLGLCMAAAFAAGSFLIVSFFKKGSLLGFYGQIAAPNAEPAPPSDENPFADVKGFIPPEKGTYMLGHPEYPWKELFIDTAVISHHVFLKDYSNCNLETDEQGDIICGADDGAGYDPADDDWVRENEAIRPVSAGRVILPDAEVTGSMTVAKEANASVIHATSLEAPSQFDGGIISKALSSLEGDVRVGGGAEIIGGLKAASIEAAGLSINGPVAIQGNIGSPWEQAEAVIDWDKGTNQRLTLAKDTKLEFLNPKDGGKYILKITQDGKGGRKIAWPENVEFSNGMPIPLSLWPARSDFIGFVYQAENDVYAVIGSAVNFMR